MATKESVYKDDVFPKRLFQSEIQTLPQCNQKVEAVESVTITHKPSAITPVSKMNQNSSSGSLRGGNSLEQDTANKDLIIQ